MSLIDVDGLANHDLVAQFVIELREQGHFLLYNDYLLISQWLGLAESADHLLVVLADCLPDYFAKKRKRDLPLSLKGIDKKIMNRLAEACVRAVDIR